VNRTLGNLLIMFSIGASSAIATAKNSEPQAMSANSHAETDQHSNPNRFGVEFHDQRGPMTVLDYRRSVSQDDKGGQLTLGFGGGAREVASETDHPMELAIGFLEIGTERPLVGTLQAYTTTRLGVERGNAGNLGFIANQIALRLTNATGFGDVAMGVDWSIVSNPSAALRTYTPQQTISPFLGISTRL